MSTKFASLNVQSAAFVRDGRRLLAPIDLKLETPGITVILGHNGAGKTLFIQMCHGLIAPSEGCVYWNGKPAGSTRKDRGFMFQDVPLLRRSVRANLEFPLLAHRIPRAERKTRIAAALGEARLEEHAGAPAASLSGGERQRLGLARAQITGPTAILMDEPSASLDPASTRALETSVRAISERGIKVLLVTHDIQQARRLADDILMFCDGTLQSSEAADTFFTRTHSGPVADYLEGRI